MGKKDTKAKLVLTEVLDGFKIRYWCYETGECWYDIDEGRICSGADSSLASAKATVRGVIKSVKSYHRNQKG